MTQQQDMVYVAADPSQPGAAWGIVVDDGKYQDDVAKTLPSWICDGANVMRVERQVGLAMMAKWKRPIRIQESLL